MPDPDLPAPARGRRYSDREVALIIKRAAELQQAEPGEGGGASGMSLAELEQIARETGIDPSFIRRAATDLDTGGHTGEPSPFLGAATGFRLERIIEGEVPESEYEVMVDMIRRATDDPGQASQLGRTVSWTPTPAGGRHAHMRRLSITIAPRNGRTTIRIEESYKPLAVALFGPLMGGGGGVSFSIAMGVGLGALHSVAAAAGIWGAFVGGAYLLARSLFTRKTDKRTRELRALMDQLAEHAAATAEITPRLPAPPGAAAPTSHRLPDAR